MGELRETERRRLTAVLACHNRRALTLNCLRGLYAQAQSVDLQVILFDDGSSDGTGDAVRAEFPRVRIVEGDGNAFWGGGMYGAMTAALEGEFDDILWLNDDVKLAPDCLDILFDAQAQARRQSDALDHIIIGAVTEPGSTAVSYGGYRRRSRLSPVWVELLGPAENGALQPCDTMNGNVVLIPAKVARAIGPNDPGLIHELGDMDYGYRAVAAGARLWIAPRTIGECSFNRAAKIRTPPGNLWQRWRALNRPHGLPFKSWWRFMWRHGGPLGILELGTIYAKRLTGL